MLIFALITSHAPSLVNFRAPLIKTLSTKGIQVLALAPNFDDRTRTAVKALGAKPVDFPMSRAGINPLEDAINTWKLARLLKELKPDITLGYFIKPVIFGSIAAWWAGVPRRFAMVEGLGYIFTPNVNGFSFKRILIKCLVRWLYWLGFSRVCRVIFLNPDDKADLEAMRIISPNKGFVLGGIGVELNEWPFLLPAVEPITFLLVARLLREKGVEDYAAAARIVKNKHPQAKFILLGGVDENPGAISQFNLQSWMDDNILEWYGHVPVQPWMRQVSVFVLPSYYREGVPASTQEAMASGRAVITTDLPGCRETVVDGENGFLVPAHNPRALAKAMLRFIDQPELIASMGIRSRQMAEEKFDAHKVNARLLREIGLYE